VDGRLLLCRRLRIMLTLYPARTTRSRVLRKRSLPPLHLVALKPFIWLQATLDPRRWMPTSWRNVALKVPSILRRPDSAAMPKTLGYIGWPLLAGILLALLLIERNPEWVGLPTQDVRLNQAPMSTRPQEGPVSYAVAVDRAAPAVANLYTTKLDNKPDH